VIWYTRYTFKDSRSGSQRELLTSVALAAGPLSLDFAKSLITFQRKENSFQADITYIIIACCKIIRLLEHVLSDLNL
jgi:hypothetical protein